MSDKPIDYRLLVDRYLDEALDPREAGELSRLMETRPEVAAYFAEAAQLIALLHEHETARIEPHIQDSASGKGETDTARMLYSGSPQEPARITRRVQLEDKRSTRRLPKSGSGGGERQYLVPLLVAAAALMGIAFLFGLSAGGPSHADRRSDDSVRRERERSELVRKADLHREEALLQEARETKAEENRVLAEKARQRAEAHLREIEEKRQALIQAKPESTEDPQAKERRAQSLEALKRDQERIEQELREAAELAKNTAQPAPVQPLQGEKPQPAPAAPATQAQGATQAALAKVEEVTGDAFLVTKEGKSALAAGANLLPGQGLETGGGVSRVILSFPDKTRVDLGPETMLTELTTDSGKRLSLTQGTVRAVVAKQPKGEPMIVTTPHGEAKVVGTTLRLAVDPDPKKGTRLEVEEGKVELKNLSGKTVMVESGHYAVAAVGAELVARVLPPRSVIYGGQAGTLTTSEGTWTFGTSVFDSGDYPTKLNGIANGAAVQLQSKNGNLYAYTQSGHWFLWQNDRWVDTGTTAPSSPSPFPRGERK